MIAIAIVIGVVLLVRAAPSGPWPYLIPLGVLVAIGLPFAGNLTGAGLFALVLAAPVVTLLQRTNRLPLWLIPKARRPAPDAGSGSWTTTNRPSSVLRMPGYMRTVAVLGRAELRRLTLHPAVIAGFALAVMFVTDSLRVPGAADERASLGTSRYSQLTTGSTWLLGLFVMFAAYGLAVRRRRVSGEALEDAAPASERQATLALALAVAVVSVATLVFVLASAVAFTQLVAGYDLPRTPPFTEFLEAPVKVLGGGWLGIMLGRWAPWRITPVVAMFALVFLGTGLLAEQISPALGFYADYAEYETSSAVAPDWIHASTREWRITYLLLMCGMALVGALLHQSGRRRELLVAGAAVTLATLGAGAAAAAI